MPGSTWAKDVLRFWLEETAPEKWFQKDDALDAIRARTLCAHP